MAKPVLRNKTDLARHLKTKNHYISWAIKYQLIPAPDVIIGKTELWSAPLWKRVLQYFQPNGYESDGYYLSKLARALDVSPERIRQWLRHEIIPEPATVEGKRQFWSQEQFEEIQKRLPELQKLRWPAYHEPPEGYYTVRGAATKLNVPNITWQSWIRNGSIDKPTKGGKHYRYYDDKDLQIIQIKKSEYFEKKMK